MNIIKESIVDTPTELTTFFKLLHSCDYVVYGEMLKFQYSNNGPTFFNLNLLKELFPEFSTQINGEIDATEWKTAFNDINQKLHYTAYGNGFEHANDDEMLDFVSDYEYEQRKNLFWKIVTTNFALPPDAIYKHTANPSSCFGNHIMWNFCYIFLKDGKGLVLHAGASD